MTQTTNKAVEKFIAARKAGTPLVNYTCFDPEAAMTELQAVTDPNVPIIQWDVIRGWKGRNDKGAKVVSETIIMNQCGMEGTINEVEQAILAQQLPAETVLFMVNGHMFTNNNAFVQALYNLRDQFKSDFRTLILVGNGGQLPVEIKNDFMSIDQQLPTDAQLEIMMRELLDCNDVPVDEDQLVKAGDALRGMPMFPAEQAVAMSLRKDGLNIESLWDYKNKLIDSTPGLKLYKGTENFDQIGGCDQVKRFLKNVANGKDAPRVVVFIDEGEKMFAGSTNEIGDNTGISQDMLATTLTFMEDNNCDGSIFLGPPGAAKSAVAKAFGNEVGIPTIMLDFGAIKGSLVGESERKLREAYKLIHAISGGRAFFIMTCNKDVSLPPELKRRFTSGTFFFDLPMQDEQDQIWSIYSKAYNLKVTAKDKANAIGWTGAEIRNCCRLAYRQNISIKEASDFIVPVAISAKADIERLRNAAIGKYLSANFRGTYKWPSAGNTHS